MDQTIAHASASLRRSACVALPVVTAEHQQREDDRHRIPHFIFHNRLATGTRSTFFAAAITEMRAQTLALLSACRNLRHVDGRDVARAELVINRCDPRALPLAELTVSPCRAKLGRAPLTDTRVELMRRAFQANGACIAATYWGRTCAFSRPLTDGQYMRANLSLARSRRCRWFAASAGTTGVAMRRLGALRKRQLASTTDIDRRHDEFGDRSSFRTPPSSVRRSARTGSSSSRRAPDVERAAHRAEASVTRDHDEVVARSRQACAGSSSTREQLNARGLLLEDIVAETSSDSYAAATGHGHRGDSTMFSPIGLGIEDVIDAHRSIRRRVNVVKSAWTGSGWTTSPAGSTIRTPALARRRAVP